jgi:PAS domain-containing protein
MVIVAPLLLTWYGRASITWTGRRMFEAAGFALLLLLAMQLVFDQPPSSASPVTVPFVMLPLFVWAAFRFGQREVTTAIAATGAISVFHTVHGRGPFATGTLNESLLALLLFIGVALFLGLVLSALLQERERALAELASRHDELKERFQLMVDSVVDYAIFMLDSRGRVASWTAGAQNIIGYRAEEILGQDYAAFFPPEDIAAGKPERVLAMAERARPRD